MPFTFFKTTDVDTLSRFGFRLIKGGAHTSRTMMLVELEALIRAVPHGSSEEQYAEAVVDRNALGKETVSSRKKSLSHLKELYALTPKCALFAALRALYQISPDSLPQLALLTALARDPLLRASAEAILPLPADHSTTPADISKFIEREFPGTYSSKSLLSISQNCASTWAQAGQLTGRLKKCRSALQPTPAGCALAFILGEVTGHHGAAMFSSLWCRAIELDPERARSLGFEAHRRGLITLRAIGEVVEVSFPCLPEAALTAR
jgi:hypothetical protein